MTNTMTRRERHARTTDDGTRFMVYGPGGQSYGQRTAAELDALVGASLGPYARHAATVDRKRTMSGSTTHFQVGSARGYWTVYVIEPRPTPPAPRPTLAARLAAWLRDRFGVATFAPDDDAANLSRWDVLDGVGQR